MYLKNKIVSTLVVALLLVTLMGQSIQGIENEKGVTKDESVYGLLKSDGSVSGMYIVNSFESDTAVVVEDLGDYKKVLNLSTIDTLSSDNGVIQVPVPAGRFYYQGDLNTTDMPWSFGIDYTLDGTSISAEDLIGKSGAVTITIEVTEGSSDMKEFYDNFTLQIGTSLSIEKFTDIKTSGGTLANAGKNKSITFSHLPGTSKIYIIEAMVSEFEMNPIQITAVFMAMDIELGSLDEMTSKFVDLKDGVNGMYEGASKLQSGGRDFEAAIDNFSKNFTHLASGSTAFKGGLIKIQQGLNQVVTGGNQLKTLATALLASEDPQVQALANGYLQQAGALEQIDAGLTAISNEYAGLNSGIQSIGGGISQLPEGYGQIQGGIDGLTDGISQMKDQTSDMDQQVEDQISSMLESFTHKNYVLQSFANEENKVNGLQFVFRTDGLKMPEKEIDPLEEEKVKSFWERLLDLFR